MEKFPTGAEISPSEEEVEKGRMGLEDAQEEANMVRVEMGQHAYSNHIWENGVSREATAEDYDRALKAVEELRQLAESEPMYAKFLEKFGEIAAKGGSMFLEVIEQVRQGWSEDRSEHFADRLGLKSAEQKLQELKDRAERFGQHARTHDNK